MSDPRQPPDKKWVAVAAEKCPVDADWTLEEFINFAVTSFQQEGCPAINVHHEVPTASGKVKIHLHICVTPVGH